MIDNKLLFCPLNWGLGHATRDVPIIKLLIKQKLKVVIATSGDSYKYLKREFPELEFIYLEGYTVKYSKFDSQIFKMFLLIPLLLFWTLKEYLMLKKIIKRYKINIVISDNRFGLWNRKTYNVYITHQLRVLFPGKFKMFETVYQNAASLIIKNFDECWIPDFEGKNNLSGELSHVNNKLANKHFIGPLSRFENIKSENTTEKIDVLFVLSGPEPQRSIFEKIIYEQTKNSKLKHVIVRGAKFESINSFNFPTYNICNTEELISLIKKADLIICRSGYSSVMDLYLLKKKAVLVPTPGQTEQEYLADYLMQRGIFYFIKQREFCLQKSIKEAFDFPDIHIEEKTKLEERILNLKERYYNY